MKKKLQIRKDYHGWCFRYHDGPFCTGSFAPTRAEVLKKSGWYGEPAHKIDRDKLGRLVRVKFVELVK